jgi:hypothetical protein
VWLYTTSGANVDLRYFSDGKTIWEMYGKDTEINCALLHFWSPQSHKHHPLEVKAAIKWYEERKENKQKGKETIKISSVACSVSLKLKYN